jgi:acetylornithine deacetylase/succinyl-diaminopimelate desuccinylase-like protein
MSTTATEAAKAGTKNKKATRAMLSAERAALEQAAQGCRDEFQGILRDLVEIPSVSMDPDHRADMGRMAEAARALLMQFGFETELLPTNGQPIVFGRRVVDPAAPTVTVYNHMDVQPGGPREEWKTEPFKFTTDGDTWYGRGTTDDKGPGLTALFGARLAQARGARVNINFLWELEEEIGSPSFAGGVKAHKDALKTDFVVVSDTIWVSRERPASPAGLRGLQPMRLILETGTTDQHSGVTGGAARNPVTELCDLVAKMVDGKTGQVKIPGFYADWRKPSAAELRDFKKSGFTVKKFMKDHLFKSLRTKDAVDVMTRIWAKPTLEVHGIAGGYQGPGVKTVVPPRAEAKISMRLVPRMRPAKMVKLVTAFVKKHAKDVQVVAESGLEPYEGTTTGPLADLIRRSMEFAFGKEPVFVREGGSIGAVKTMEDVLDAPVVFLGLSLPEHGYHAPNENYDWMQARGGMVAFARLFEEAAALPRSAAHAALAAKRGK